MTRLTIVAAFAVFSTTSTMPTTAGSEPAGHHHEMEGFSVGEPGDPKDLSRIIQVSMEERDGKMLYVPAQVEIRKGETIKFVIYNSGELNHEFVLASTEENLEHAEMMMKNPEMQHADPNARRVAPKQTSEIIWKFTKAGQFEFACLIPGHRDAGMIGTVDVK
jgi:uncharacterized cupredoxin-like copper-binding protein